MPTLHVRNVPNTLYTRLQTLADAGGRSLSAEVIALLDDAVARGELRRQAKALLAHVRAAAEDTKLPKDWVDAVALLREDRRR